MKTNLIVTASDRKYGDFLIEHWLASLLDTPNSGQFDIAVLDYGLSRAQHFYLESNGILVRKCVRDGHVTSIRYRDLQHLLSENPQYEQILLCDSGDMIFQDDITPVFSMSPDTFRAACEDYKPLFSVFISSDFFDPEDKEKLLNCFIKNPMINGGFVAAPREKMMQLCSEMNTVIKDKSRFGPDQIVLNGFLYENGFERLSSLYNYVIATAKRGIVIRDGVFYTEDGELIKVVHNAGNIGIIRPVENFGYGPSYNQLKEEMYRSMQALYESMDGLFRTRELFLDSRRKARDAVRKFLEEFREKTKRHGF